MKARVIAIGDELLFGRHVDTNSTAIARWCLVHGLRVAGIAILPDDADAIAAAMRAAAGDAGLVVVTGGLGPTDDDRTRDALARAMDVPLRESATAARMIDRTWARIGPGKRIPDSNRVQALAPRGAKILANDRGTAPGLLGRVGDAWVACLPGVPHEMMAMLDRLGRRLPTILPSLKVPEVAEISCSGIGESTVQDRLGDLLASDGITVGITAHEDGHLTLRVVGAKTAVRRRAAALRRALEGHLLPENGLPASILARCRRQGWTITCAESCTAGAVVLALGRVPGASDCLERAAVTYADDGKVAVLGVDPATLKHHGAVSEEVVAQMAEGAARVAGADLALATTGVAGPTGGSRAKPVGTVWLAVSFHGATRTRLVHLQGDRERIQRRAAAAALQLGWEMLTTRGGAGRRRKR